tara:strand:- start:4772 stop:5149 length:378 start_codon:yes stop_codon:yes gene_type:complete
MEVIEFHFFTDTPIDFEFKKYSLLSYLVKADAKYVNLEFSPWLLHNERLYIDISNYIDNFEIIKQNMTDKTVRFSDRSIFYHYEEPETLNELEEIGKLIKYAKPKIWKSNIFGKELAKNSGAILW